ncbi:FUSC family protein [Gordonia desulfuricans]|uniref:FUSC family protein n=1 Tax=Gordonia desulfuricans TaxID=89051 RepID=A0A7K3LR23_9ACTN|nr:FUSC family protein [Gordonia desulfuricans]NDK90626.1 FUSC family protein [Gordonia desulfuricans]
MNDIGASGWRSAAMTALRPADNPWAVRPALTTAAAALVVVIIGLALGRAELVAVTLFGTACAAVLADRTATRQRCAWALALQALGACVGIAVGSLTTDPVGQVAIAAAVAFVSGPLGRVGRSAAGCGLMAIIGVAFAQFGGTGLPWYQQCLCYLVGTAAIAVVDLGPWPWQPRGIRRAAVAAVFRASATLVDAAGTDDAPAARSSLLAASERARHVVFGPHLPRPHRRPTPAEVAWQHAADAALVAAATGVDCRARGADAAQMRDWADAIEHGLPIDWPAQVVDVVAPAGPRRSEICGRDAVFDGVRIAWCLALATVATIALHDPSHSVWIPLTVSVLVRPEYGTVFMRVTNRLSGTVAGGVLAAILLLVLGSGLPVAVAAAVAIGFSVAAAPKSYGLSVIGVTCGALMSASIATADPVVPLIRVGDTLLGAVIALMFGFLLWPGRGVPDPTSGVRTARRAARRYLRSVVDGAGVAAAGEEAYSRANRAVEQARTALLEPPPIGAIARTHLADALAVKGIVDEVTALRRVDEAPDRAQLDALRSRLETPDRR